MSEVTLKVSRIIVDTKLNIIYVVCPSSKFNTSGAFKMSMAQATNMAVQAGLKNIQQLIRNCKGGTLSFDAEFVKAGDTWVNKSKNGGGEEGTYKKDHCKVTNFSFELSQEKSFILEAAANASDAIASAFAGVTASALDPEDKEVIPDDNGEMQIAQTPVIEQTA